MEKLKYSEKVKAEKSRQPFVNDIKPSYSEKISRNRMDDKCRKSKDLDESFVPTTLDHINAELEESEHVIRSQREEKKLAFKLYCRKKKEETKKEKQREREERMLKKIVGPKGESVSVIDQDMFQKISSTQSPIMPMYRSDGLSMDSLSFPDLRHSFRRTSKKSEVNLETPTVGGVIDRVVDKVDGRVGVSTKTQEKSRRKKDPVVVDILRAIEICKAERQPSKKTNFNTVGKKSAQAISRISGNILDSSNPLRHRGKKREGPKKHCLTRVKKAIMLERERRRALRDISRKMDPSVPVHEGRNVKIRENTESIFYQENAAERLQMKEEQPVALSNHYSLVDKGQEDSSREIVDIDSKVKEKLHSKKFREYCDHSKSPDLSEAVTSMLQDIIRFQDRAHANQPIKAEMHRRYVVGLKQANNLLRVQKVKIIIMASDIEKVPAPGGLDDMVTTIVDCAKKQGVPVIFNFLRRQLGKLTYRKVPVSCIAILNYHGTEAAFQKMTETLEVAKKDYSERFMAEKSRIMEELGIPVVKMEKADIELKTVEPDPDITFPLLKRLTEAISEFSIQSSHNSDDNDEPLPLTS